MIKDTVHSINEDTLKTGTVRVQTPTPYSGTHSVEMLGSTIVMDCVRDRSFVLISKGAAKESARPYTSGIKIFN